MVKSLRTPGHLALMRVLTETRKVKGLTQQQLAERVGRPQSYIAKIETGERRLDVVELVELAAALEVATAVLVGPIEQVARPRKLSE